MAHTKFPLAKDTLPINDYKFIISFCGGRRKENNIKSVYDKVFCFCFFTFQKMLNHFLKSVSLELVNDGNFLFK